MSTDPAAASRKMAVYSLVAAGTLMIVAGIIVGLWLGAGFFLITAVGFFDLALAWAFASGRIGVPAGEADPAPEPPASGPDVTAREATDDPDYNPHARED